MSKRRRRARARRQLLTPKKEVTQESLELAYHNGMVAIPSEGPMPVMTQDLEEKVYGKRGVPNDDPVIDLLGRVNGRTYPKEAYVADPNDKLNDNIPEFLRNPMVKPPENVQEHKIISAPNASEITRRITILRDHTLDYPLLGMSIYVSPDPDVPDDEARFARMFARSYSKRANTPEEADLVIFAGGADVDPLLYGETAHESVVISPDRDLKDIQLYNKCLEQGIPMLGICRGAQFGHVMNKGKLWQHVDNHYGDHTIWDLRQGINIQKVSSVHHQMVIENCRNGMEILATTAKSKERWANKTNMYVGNNADIEAFFYRNSCFLGIQGHPEYDGYHYYTNWCIELVYERIYCNPDLSWQNKLLRVKPDILTERKSLANLPIKNKIKTKGKN